MVKNKFVIYTGFDELGKVLVIEHQCGFYGSEYYICSINTNKKLTKKAILELVEPRNSHSKKLFSDMGWLSKISKLYEVVW